MRMKLIHALAPCGAVACLSLSACVPQPVYDDAQLGGKHYQNESIEKQKRIDELEAENRRLKAEVGAGGSHLSDASYSTDAIDERLANLRSIMAQIGQNPDDVVKFSVEGGYVYRMKDSIVFDSGSAEVSSAGKKILAEVAGDIASKPYGKVYVRGHTDSTPIAKPETKARFPMGNLQLSAERAVAVAAFLGDQGKLEEKRVVVMGFGPHDPVAPNDGDGNKQKNRRVDIFVADAQSTGGTQK